MAAGRACGWLRDRFGVPWQIVPSAIRDTIGGPDAAGAARAMQAMLAMVKLDIEGLRGPMRARRGVIREDAWMRWAKRGVPTITSGVVRVGTAQLRLCPPDLSSPA